MARVEWREAPDIKKRVDELVGRLEIKWIEKKDIHCFRSNYSSARAYARIWGLNQVWQLALKEKPAYVLEVLGENFDKLNSRKQDEILLHELAHIPRNFSGALKPHTHHKKGGFHDILKGFKEAYDRFSRET